TSCSRVFAEVFGFAVVLEIDEMDGHGSAGFHHVHEAEAVESCAVFFEAVGKLDGEELAFEGFGFWIVAGDAESELAFAGVGIGIVIKGPMVRSAVLFDGCGAEFSGDERSDECAAGFVVATDEADGEACAGAFAIEIEPERIYRPAAAAGLAGVKPAKENAAV